jgi:uncharacterized protein YgfB (UPF0149 family)
MRNKKMKREELERKWDRLDKEYSEIKAEYNSYKWGAELLGELRDKIDNDDFDLKKFIEDKEDEFWKKTTPIASQWVEHAIKMSRVIVEMEQLDENSKDDSSQN